MASFPAYSGGKQIKIDEFTNKTTSASGNISLYNASSRKDVIGAIFEKSNMAAYSGYYIMIYTDYVGDMGAHFVDLSGNPVASTLIDKIKVFYVE